MTEHQHRASPAAGGEGASQLKRGLSARHIQMIALGGAIGTGLFMGAGRNIAVAGTSILVIYVLVGFFTYMVMRAMGELLLTAMTTARLPTLSASISGRRPVFTSAGPTG